MSKTKEITKTALREQWIEAHVHRLLYLWTLGPPIPGKEVPSANEIRQFIKEQLAQPITAKLEHCRFEFENARELGEPNVAPVEAVNMWNEEWRRLTKDGQKFGPSLQEVHFDFVNIPGIDRRNADLSRCDEKWHSKHRQTNFQGANLSGANLTNVDLAGATLNETNLSGAHLSQTALSEAKLRKANLSGAVLTGAILDAADLTGADLTGADLTNASTHRAILDEANLLGTTGLMLDENSVYRTRFAGRLGITFGVLFAVGRCSTWLMRRLRMNPKPLEIPQRADAWSTLRRTYTGPSFIINLLLVAIFVLPYLMHALFLRELGRLESGVLQSLQNSTGLILEPTDVADPQEIQQLKTRVEQRLNTVEGSYQKIFLSLSSADNALTSFAPNCLEASISDAHTAVLRISEKVRDIQKEMQQARFMLNRLSEHQISQATLVDSKLGFLRIFGRSLGRFSDARRGLRQARQNIASVPPNCMEPAYSRIAEEIENSMDEVDRVYGLVDDATPDIQKLLATKVAENTYSVWEILLGLDRIAEDRRQFGWTVLIVVLIFYNILRGFLTLAIAPMRDDEDRSQITPSKVEYRWMLKWSKAVMILKVVAIFVAFYELIHLLRTPVIKFW